MSPRALVILAVILGLIPFALLWLAAWGMHACPEWTHMAWFFTGMIGGMGAFAGCVACFIEAGMRSGK